MCLPLSYNFTNPAVIFCFAEPGQKNEKDLKLTKLKHFLKISKTKPGYDTLTKSKTQIKQKGEI